MAKGWQYKWSLVLVNALTVGGALLFTSQALAQNITLDGTLGTAETLTGANYIIPQSAGKTVGNNLFHSFGKFNLNSNESAIFQSADNIRNILSRVTGGNQSLIDGLIRTQTGVNLFLINPNGIIFGQNARLNVGGSFVASTANALQFGNLGVFSATEKNVPSPLLTINPSALLFNQINQNAAIQNNSVAPAGRDPAGFNAFGLRVPDGKSLLLVGGNVSMDGGQLNAYGGRVELGGLAAPGNVNLVFNGDNLRLKFPDHVTRADVSLTNQAGVYVEGAGGGNIAINARNLDLLGGSQLSGGIGRGLGTPATVAGDITLNATGEIQVFSESFFLNNVRSQSKGNGGDINISTKRLFMDDGGVIAITFSEGKAGNIKINTEQLVVRNLSGIAAYTYGTGDAGNISIETGSLSVINSQVGSITIGKGNAGNLTVNATDSVEVIGKIKSVSTNIENPAGLLAQVNIAGEGRGGNLTIETKRLSVSNGGKVQVATFGQGDAGNLLIRAADVEVFDTPVDNLFATGINAGVEIDADQQVVPPTGKGGTLTIETERLSVRSGGTVSVATSGEGDAGRLLIRASDSVEVIGTSPNGKFKSQITAAVTPDGTGRGGNLQIETGKMIIRDGAEVTVSSLGTGVAGNLDIQARSISLNNQGSISAITNSGNGGDITLNLQELLLLRRNSQISTNAGTEQKGGNGGNININTPFIVAVPNENSDISANAFTGIGGKVTINATGIYGIIPRSREDLVRLLGTTEPKDLDPAKLPTSDITAISQTNPILNGDVILNTPDLDPSRGLFQLPTNLVDVSQQIVQRCTPKGKTASHFISTGRGGLPLNPEEPLRGRAVITNWVTLGEGSQQTREITNQSTPEKIIEAQGWVINSDGKVELVAYVPGSTSNNSSLTSNLSCNVVSPVSH